MCCQYPNPIQPHLLLPFSPKALELLPLALAWLHRSQTSTTGQSCFEFCMPAPPTGSKYQEQMQDGHLPPDRQVCESSEAQSNVMKAQAYLSLLIDIFRTPLSPSHCPCRSSDDRLLSQ